MCDTDFQLCVTLALSSLSRLDSFLEFRAMFINQIFPIKMLTQFLFPFSYSVNVGPIADARQDFGFLVILV